MKLTNRRLLLLLSLFATLIIGTSMYFVLKWQLTLYNINNSRERFSEEIQSYASENINFSLPKSLKLDSNFENFTNSLNKIPGYQNLLVFDSNGFVVFSNDKKEIGQNRISEEPIKKAINGDVSDSGFNKKTYEITYFSPIKSVDGNVKGIVSAKINLSKTLSDTDQIILTIIVIAAFMGISVLGVIYFLFSSAQNTISEKERQVNEKSKALEEEEQLDEAIMASIAESLVVINQSGQIIVFNPEAERISGYKNQDVEYRLFKNILVFCDKDGKEMKRNPISDCLKTGQKTLINIKDGFYIKNAKKELTPISVSAAPILDKERKIQGVAATIQDITTEKELDKVKDEFVYVVAHELGNPIFALDGYLSILETQLGKTNKKNTDILGMARGVNQQLSNLVNDLLEVVRNEQGTLACEVALMDLAALTKTVIENARFKARSKKIKLEYGSSSKIPKVIGNEQKIKEVLTNLVDNAIKYTPEGGRVEVNHQIIENGVVTNIKDNGFGISAEDQKQLFQKFYRVKTDKTSGITGTGLGLFICREIVEKCGGRIWAESEDGNGSTFSFSLKIVK